MKRATVAIPEGAAARLAELEASGLEPHSGELLVVLVWLVSGEVTVAEAERKAALRRAMLVLAAGGDPHREVDLDSVAVARLADELDSPVRRAALRAGLDALAEPARELPVVSEALAILAAEPELAWRGFALALLADELADE